MDRWHPLVGIRRKEGFPTYTWRRFHLEDVDKRSRTACVSIVSYMGLRTAREPGPVTRVPDTHVIEEGGHPQNASRLGNPFEQFSRTAADAPTLQGTNTWI